MRNNGNISELYEQVKQNSLNHAIENIVEKLGKNADMGDYIDDFAKSDAPQFKGASKEKRRDMAIAAFLDQKDKKEGFASDAQRRAAFAQGYKAKGKKGKKEETELDEAKYQVNYSKGGKLFSKTVNAKNEDDAEDKAIKQFKIEDDDIRSVVKEEIDIQEDGHVDVASAVRQCKTITEDAMQMLQKLQTMSPEDALPTWWTNKLAVASNNMNKMRDYLLVPSVSEEVELDEAIPKSTMYGVVVKGKYIAKGSKQDMLKLAKKTGGELMNAPGKKVGDSAGKAEEVGEELDKDDEDTVKTIIGKLKKASQAHAGQAKQLTKDLQDNFSPSMIAKLKKTYEPLKGKKINPNPLMKIFDKIDSNKNGLIQLYKADIPFVSTMAMSRLTLKHNMKADEVKKLREEVELDEMDMKYVLINMHGKVQGYASDEKDAKDIARRTKSTIHKIKKKISDKTLDKMNALNRTPKELQDLGIIEEVELSETIVDFDYSRNPKAIFNAFLQMSRRLNLTLFNAPTGMKDLQSKGTGRIGGTKQNMLKFMKYLNSKGIEPKVEIINEQKSATGYELFHKSFSDAMQHAYAHAKSKMGMTVDPKEIDSKVATGPKKPGTGKTNSYSLKTNKGMLQIQVYNRGGSKPFELNMYSS